MKFDEKQKRYTLQEVADIIGVSRQTIYVKVRAGLIKAYKPAKEYFVLEDDLQNFLRQCSNI